MKTIKLSFPNSKGEMLAAKLDLPIGEHPSACALFAHCFTCSKNLLAVRNISRALTQHGFAVMSFDFTGLGESEGEFADTNFSSNVGDLVSAAEYLAQNYQAPGLLIGHSLGGAAVLQAGPRIESVKAIATLGAPADPAHVRHHFQEGEAEIEEKGSATVSIGGRPFRVKKQFLDDLEASTIEEILPRLKKAILVMHSPQDTIVGIENAARIYQAARHPKSYISLDGADHLLSRKADSQYAGNMIAAWATRYIDTHEQEKLVTDKQVVVRTGANGYTTEIQAGPHSFLADEPASVGGADLGPTPYNLLNAALGACTSMTLRMYADRKGWDLQEVKVHLQHFKEHKADSEGASGGKQKIDVIERVIELEGELDGTQRARLLEIADRCPVHRTLHSEIEVRSTLSENA